MYYKNLLIIFALLHVRCDGQLADFFFPRMTNTVRDVAEGVLKHPIVHLSTQATGHVITSAADALTKIPLAIARSFDMNSPLPTLISSHNLLDLKADIVADFNAGLGNEDANLNIKQLCNKYGYPIEEHLVVTEDGYILAMFRIPGNGSAVLLMHGLLGSADDFVVAGPRSGLAYLLANEGYDVWMGNARGNKYSRRHSALTPADAAFWDFSWHEIGVQDLPAMIDHVLAAAGQTSLKYVGHSQGTTVFFVMASEKPEYNAKIAVMVALSPVGFMANVKSPLVRLLAPGTPFIHGFARSVGLYEFLPDDAIMRSLKMLMCGSGILAEILCSNVLFLVAGFGFGQLNVTNLPIIYGHLPSGASAKQVAHYGQGVVSRDFRQFDHGTVGNLQRYGSDVPPSYNLKNVMAPVALFYSDADWLAHPDDVHQLYGKLNNVVDLYKVPFEQFNHLDFIWAKDFETLIFDRLRKLFLNF